MDLVINHLLKRKIELERNIDLATDTMRTSREEIASLEEYIKENEEEIRQTTQIIDQLRGKEG